MATIKEIAESLHLSSATVSRALRNDETLSITAETKTRIFMAAEKMGYQTKGKKNREPAHKLTFTVLHKQQTFRNQIDSSYYFSVRTGIEDSCSRSGVACNFAAMESLDSYPIQTDGIIIVGNYPQKQFQYLVQLFPQTPMVTVGIISYYPERIDHITHSNYESLKIALNYFFEQGFREIGYLGIEEAPETSLFGSRKEFFEQITKEHGCFNPKWIYESSHGRDRVEQGYATMKEWIEKGSPLPKALFCANDPLALGAVRALTEAEIRIPEDISIIAHDGSFPAQYSIPPLSTIDVHPYQMGYEAAKTLLERFTEKRNLTKKIYFYPELILRESVRKIEG